MSLKFKNTKQASGLIFKTRKFLLTLAISDLFHLSLVKDHTKSRLGFIFHLIFIRGAIGFARPSFPGR